MMKKTIRFHPSLSRGSVPSGLGATGGVRTRVRHLWCKSLGVKSMPLWDVIGPVSTTDSGSSPGLEVKRKCLLPTDEVGRHLPSGGLYERLQLNWYCTEVVDGIANVREIGHGLGNMCIHVPGMPRCSSCYMVSIANLCKACCYILFVLLSGSLASIDLKRVYNKILID